MTENSVDDSKPLMTQIAEPDWDEVRDFARQAAEATVNGEMKTANDLYQFVAIEVMHALYGPDAIVKFINYAMDQEAKKIVIAKPNDFRFKV